MIVEVVFATPALQKLARLDVPEGTTARQAALDSGLDAFFSELNLASVPVGVFGETVPDDHQLTEGDRVELYRELIIDPKEARRQRAIKAQR